jgi:hypothetical protein
MVGRMSINKNRMIALKNGKNYPVDWKDKEIKDELKSLTDRINEYKAGKSGYPTENLIHDAFNFNFGHAELQNRKTNRILFLVALIAIVTFAVASETAWLGYVIYKSGENAEKTQKANTDILSSINQRLNDIAHDIEDIGDLLLQDNTNLDPLNSEQANPLLNET